MAPMLSLESVTDFEAVRRFDERVRIAAGGKSVRCVLQPKLDGLSLEVVYRRGMLLRASTRGDGEHGEAVTENVRTIRSVPLRLRGRSVPLLLAVRGAAIMRREDFRALNAGLEKAGQPQFANPRNAAAGSIRQLDPRVTAGRRLDVFFYDILHIVGGPRLTNDMGVVRALEAWGLPAIPLTQPSSDPDDVRQYQRNMARRRAALGYEIDGIVVKVADLALRARLGATARHPRWALAFKFAAREVETTIADITVQVGRSGVLTPVALLRPVTLGGVTITRATLHNREEVARKDLRVGDIVSVIRAGDVIPEVVRRVHGGSARRGPAFVMPARCPACAGAVVRHGPVDRCPQGLACPAQLERSIRHFGSRAAMDIHGLGPKTVEALVGSGLVRSAADLFASRQADLIKVKGFSDTSAANLVQAIAGAKRRPLWRFVHALGVPGVGARTARNLADHFGTLDRLQSAGETDKTAVPGIGPNVARDITAFFHRPAHRRVVDLFRRRGLEVFGTPARRRGSLARHG